MHKTVENFFIKNKLDLNNKQLVVAVSTGIDSMALLTSILKLKSKYNLKVFVAHFNHLKREQSTEEEQFILGFCKDNGIDCFVGHLEKKANDNFQNYAREQRYTFFKKIMIENDADYLLLAHHAIDNMETILMRIIRGSSLKGYSGIDEISTFNNKLLLRPLLNVLKDDIISYVGKENIKYYQDESNFDDIYTRNRIRKELIPTLFKEDNNVHLKFEEFSNIIKEASNVIEERVIEFIRKTDNQNDKISFSIKSFLNLSEFIQIEVLFYILKNYSLSKAYIFEIIKMIKSNKKNLKVIIKDSFTFVKEYDIVSFYFEIIEPLKVDFVVSDIGRYRINDTIYLNVSKKSSDNISQKSDLCYNSNMLPVRVRTRKNGDRILLDAGYKKVKDLLIDEKVGIIKRERILIIEKDNDILAVHGIKKSSLLKKIKNNDIIIKVEYNNG